MDNYLFIVHAEQGSCEVLVKHIFCLNTVTETWIASPIPNPIETLIIYGQFFFVGRTCYTFSARHQLLSYSLDDTKTEKKWNRGISFFDFNLRNLCLVEAFSYFFSYLYTCTC